MNRTLLSIALTLMLSHTAQAANHREAPITALDHKADITDVYAFRSYSGDATPKVTLIMGVDPLLEPAAGPNWFPFDPDILYELKVDNNYDAKQDIVFEFRFTTEQRLPGLFQVYAGIEVAPMRPPIRLRRYPPALRSCPTASTVLTARGWAKSSVIRSPW